MACERVIEGRTSQRGLAESLQVRGPDDAFMTWKQPWAPGLSMSLHRKDTHIESVQDAWTLNEHLSSEEAQRTEVTCPRPSF